MTSRWELAALACGERLQHLRVLENASLVTGRKVGRERHLALAPLPLKRIHDRWINHYTRAAVELLDRLEDA